MIEATDPVPPEMTEALGLIERLGGPELVLRIAGLFEESARERARKFEQVMAANDRLQLSHLAHAIKGSAAQIGAEPLRVAAEALERDADTLDRERLRTRVDSLQALVDRAVGQLAALAMKRSSEQP
ncbi:MAG: Hpt domain-containing protein [Gemmatimonadaceae bacterium]